MSNYTIELLSHHLMIKTPNGGWETRDRYTGKLADFSIDPELDYTEYREIDQEVKEICRKETVLAQKLDQKSKKKKG